MYENSWLLNN